MGVVLKGQDTRLGRPVAIKVPPPHLSTIPEFRARFIREARALARLKHPNIGGVYDVTDGETGDCPVMVMEYLDGSTLLALLRNAGTLSLETARDWIRQLGLGLSYVHSKGVLHRDVKPANLMLVEGEVKILDFGLASLDDGTCLTRTGGLGGSIGYMPPEQIRGEQVDQRADVYAMAATAYQLLTSELPFRVEDKMRRAIPRISSQRDELPAGLDKVFSRALAPYPEDRYETVAEFVVAMDEAFEGLDPSLARTAIPA
jgi:serine/threonine-protein kinase